MASGRIDMLCGLYVNQPAKGNTHGNGYLSVSSGVGRAVARKWPCCAATIRPSGSEASDRASPDTGFNKRRADENRVEGSRR